MSVHPKLKRLLFSPDIIRSQPPLPPWLMRHLPLFLRLLHLLFHRSYTQDRCLLPTGNTTASLLKLSALTVPESFPISVLIQSFRRTTLQSPFNLPPRMLSHFSYIDRTTIAYLLRINRDGWFMTGPLSTPSLPISFPSIQIYLKTTLKCLMMVLRYLICRLKCLPSILLILIQIR